MRIVSVNITQPRTLSVKDHEVETSIFKRPVDHPLNVDHLGLENERRISKRMCDPEDHAIYMYPHEHYEVWAKLLGVTGFPCGQFGENVTTRGLLETEIRIGDVLGCGDTTLQVRQPRLPCAKLNVRMGCRFAGRFLRSRRLGFFLRVLEPGRIQAGDGIRLLERDPSAPSVDELIRISQIDYWDAIGLERLLASKRLPAAWRESLHDKLARAKRAEGWHGFREFIIDERQQGAGGAVSLWLRCAEARPLVAFKPGQQLTVTWRDPADIALRSTFAITSSPERLERYCIAVPAEGSADALSRALQSEIPVGAALRVAAPRGEE